ncbi:NigD-like C-terminal domain-containing protein [Mediterranea sp. An20]|uniref:NigD1/NigD2 family lipoprotein n=1 Tax=Mediterranea sp. An20 TaxID=1965586 RepID=UPI001EF4530D|nr:NigD-like C-terminal domain-containing protein [Mediterranea sp. An20]
MRKMHGSLRKLLMLPAALLLWAACSDDDYHYPSVSLEYLTARSNSAGTLETVLTDGGGLYAVLNEVTAPNRAADSTLRIIANYACELADNGDTTGVLLYSASTVVSPVPQPAAAFAGGVKTDPASVLSIWMGLDYLNVVLEIKGTDAAHAFHFVEDKVEGGEEEAHREVALTLYHDAADDPPYYTRRAYLSVPLCSYITDQTESLTVRFSLQNEEDETETYTFNYLPRR